MTYRGTNTALIITPVALSEIKVSTQPDWINDHRLVAVIIWRDERRLRNEATTMIAAK